MLYVEQTDDGTILSVSSNYSILEHLSTIKVLCKGQVKKLRLIFELNIHSLVKLALDKLRCMKYKSTNPNAYVYNGD